jgi:hypothetical protein
VLQQCVHDPAQRVVINALVGLCRIGDNEAPKRLIALAQSPDAVARAGAAWGKGNACSVGSSSPDKAFKATTKLPVEFLLSYFRHSNFASKDFRMHLLALSKWTERL